MTQQLELKSAEKIESAFNEEGDTFCGMTSQHVPAIELRVELDLPIL